MMTINTNSMLDEECGQECFDSVTDEELILSLALDQRTWHFRERSMECGVDWTCSRQGIRQEQNVYADRVLGNKNVMNVLRAIE